MATAPSPQKVQDSGTLQAILWGGLACGVLDITAAFILYGVSLSLLQGIAAGVLGLRSFHGGIPTALLGLFLHFVIAYGAATVYVVASRALDFLVNHTIISGVLYGIAVYFFMNRIVVPLSRAWKFPFSVRGMIIGIVVHILCVGLPISIVTKHFSAVR